MAQFEIKQLLAGRDHARGNRQATQMQNFAYLAFNRETMEGFLIDPAWDVEGLLKIADDAGVKLLGVLATHAHPDHIGGSWLGLVVEGIVELLKLRPMPVHCHKTEAKAVEQSTGIPASRLTLHEDGAFVNAGDLKMQILHTPGHTAGSCCWLTEGALFSGDTLFLQGCGRVDLPGGDAREMRESLMVRLSKVPDSFVLYPGHAYGGASALMSDVRRTNRSLIGGMSRM